MVLKFKINGALGSRKCNLLYLLFPRDLVNLGDVLADDLVHRGRMVVLTYTHLTDEAVQKFLPQLVTMCVPIQTVGFTERVELLDSYQGAISTSWCEELRLTYLSAHDGVS